MSPQSIPARGDLVRHRKPAIPAPPPRSTAAPSAGAPAEPLCWPAALPDSTTTEPLTREKLRALLQGDVEADAYKELLAQVARARGALHGSR